MARDWWDAKEAAKGMKSDRVAAAKSQFIRDKRRKKAGNPTKPKPLRTDDNFYRSLAWRQIRYLALKNSGGCNCCGATAAQGALLHVDHIKPISKYPELKLSLDNVQVLCEDCNVGKGSWDETDWRA